MRIEGITQQIMTDSFARDCSYSRGLNSRKSSPSFEGEQWLRDLREWLCPPDPSINHNIACDSQHERTLVWLFKDTIFKEWESKGSLLWIHGKRAFLYAGDLLDLIASSQLARERASYGTRFYNISLYRSLHSQKALRSSSILPLSMTPDQPP